MKKLFLRKFTMGLLATILFLNPQLRAENTADSFWEAETHFTFKGKPIHPGLVQEFSSWISDPGLPTTISVDISAPHGNEYFEDDVREEDNKRVCVDKWINEEDDAKRKIEGSFCYKWLGKLNNGLHVLETWEDFGGTYVVFMDLMFVRFNKDEGYDTYNKKDEVYGPPYKYKRLLMSIVCAHGLGDTGDGKINVLSDRVIVGQLNKKSIELKFD